MAIQTASYAAPPTPWSRDLAEPQIDSSAYIHTFSNVIGDVWIGANVLIAPGVSVRADEGSPFHIGSGSNLQDGVVIHGLEQGRVVGDDGERYSVWIGKNSSITHMALVHGPCYVGDDCFIGFRSTVFNARIGKGCIVMLHALIQDVEIPEGRFVPSGAIITTQEEANRLPKVKEVDLKFARHVIHINDQLREGYLCADNVACIAPLRSELEQGDTHTVEAEIVSSPNGNGQRSKTMDTAVFDQVQQLVNQGFRIGLEFADERRFRTSSWHSAPSISASSTAQALTQLNQQLAEHSGNYVRLIGIDPKDKRRVLETIIQRPGQTIQLAGTTGSTNGKTATVHPVAVSNSSESDVVTEVQKLVSQGYRIGLEFADERRFRTSSWHSGPAISETSTSHVLNLINQQLAEHSGEFVRLIGIDTKDKRRVLERIIQRPGAVAKLTATAANQVSGGVVSATIGQGDWTNQVHQLLNQGFRVGLEFADERRFRTSSWNSGPVIAGSAPAQVLSQLQQQLAEHSGEFVRLIGVDTKDKRRVFEAIIHRPGAKVAAVSSGAVTPIYKAATPTAHAYSSSKLPAEVVQQVRNLLNQGHRIGTEHVDKRRFQTNSWASCAPITTQREPEVLSALEACLAEHAGEYVRLIGVDAKDKRRVLELILQRP